MKTTRCGRIAGILIVAAVLGLEGCASTATREAMSVGTRATKSYPYSISVQTRGGTETGAMTGSTISNEELKGALESSIIESKLFKSVAQGGNGDYELMIVVTQLTKPVFGASFTVDLETGWSLVKTSDKSVVMRKVIKSSSTATLDDAIVGATRMRLAVEGAARKNIAQGLQAIAALRAGHCRSLCELPVDRSETGRRETGQAGALHLADQPGQDGGSLVPQVLQ